MRGKEILVNGEFGKGRYEALYNGTGGDLYPGTIVQKDTTALKGGQHTAVKYDRGADGDLPAGGFCVVLNTMGAMVGRTNEDPIPSGEIFQGYFPLTGDELNLLWGDVSGTGTSDVIEEGTLGMVDDGTGEIVAVTGTPATIVCRAKERVALDGDSLVWSEWAA